MNQEKHVSNAQGTFCYVFNSFTLWCCTELEYILTKVKKASLNSPIFHSSPESLWCCSWTSDQTLHAATSFSSEWSPWSQRGYTKTGHTKEAGVWHHQCANWYPVNQKDVQKQDPVDVSLDQTLFPQFHIYFHILGLDKQNLSDEMLYLEPRFDRLNTSVCDSRICLCVQGIQHQPAALRNSGAPRQKLTYLIWSQLRRPLTGSSKTVPNNSLPWLTSKTMLNILSYFRQSVILFV